MTAQTEKTQAIDAEGSHRGDTAADATSVTSPEAESEMYVADVAFEDDDGYHWLAGVTLNLTTGACVDISGIRPALGSGTHPWWETSELVVPVASLVEAAWRAHEEEDALSSGLLMVMAREVILMNGLVEQEQDGSWILVEGQHRIPGVRLAKAPREERGRGSDGAPPISDGFLQEVAAVHKLGNLHRARRADGPRHQTREVGGYALLRHYLSALMDPPPSERAVRKWVTTCREKGLIPPSRPKDAASESNSVPGPEAATADR